MTTDFRLSVIITVLVLVFVIIPYLEVGSIVRTLVTLVLGIIALVVVVLVTRKEYKRWKATKKR